MTDYRGDTVALSLQEGLKAISSSPRPGLSLRHSHVHKEYDDERDNIARLPQDSHKATTKVPTHLILSSDRVHKVAQ